MRRIKVTGYMDLYEWPDDHYDLTHRSGLSELGQDAAAQEFGEALQDLSFELVGDATGEED